MVDVYLLSVIAFFAILAILIYRDRKNVEVKNRILVIKRTKKFRDLLDNIARISPRFWKIFSTIGILIAISVMVVGFLSIGKTSYDVASGLYEQPPYQFVIPTPTATGSIGPGYISIPFWFWIITIAIILIPHEFLHGVIARTEKIKLKSVGLLVFLAQPFALLFVLAYSLSTRSFNFSWILAAIFLILPGAFVEPDENQLKKSKLLTRLRVFAAGSFANILIAIFAVLIMMFLIWPSSVSPGIYIVQVNETGPAGLAGLKPNVTLLEINGEKIDTRLCNPLGSLIGETCRGVFYVKQFENLEPNQIVTLKSNESSYTLRLSYNENTRSPYMGIGYAPVTRQNSGFQLDVLMPLFSMIALFSFAVGMINILPIYPLDGGLMFEAVMKKVSKKNYKKIVKAITIIIILMIFYGFVGPYLR
jgi:membrane-associated protease RseP (regulator of RpoE activity)